MPLHSTESVFVQTVVAFLLASCAILTGSGEIVRGPYLQLSHSTGITVVWRTSEALANPTVKYWTDENVDSSAVTRKILVREATGPEYFPLSDFAEHLKEGRNVIAIEGHNTKSGSSDFTIDPYLVIVNEAQ